MKRSANTRIIRDIESFESHMREPKRSTTSDTCSHVTPHTDDIVDTSETFMSTRSERRPAGSPGSGRVDRARLLQKVSDTPSCTTATGRILTPPCHSYKPLSTGNRSLILERGERAGAGVVVLSQVHFWSRYDTSRMIICKPLKSVHKLLNVVDTITPYVLLKL